jgi:hypothetical protein
MPPLTPPGSDLCADAVELVFAGSGDTRIAHAEGDTTGLTSDSGCDGVPSTRRLPDQFYAFTLEDTRDVQISVAPVGTYDPAFYVLAGCDATESIACYDTGPPGYTESLLVEGLGPGRYVLGVDAFEHGGIAAWESGAYALDVIATRP